VNPKPGLTRGGAFDVTGLVRGRE